MPKQDEDFNTDKDLGLNYLEEGQQPEQDYIDEMIEYQNNQFNPGYYVGTGKTPPSVKASGNAMPLAICLFIEAAVIIIMYCIFIKYLFFNTSTVTIGFSVGSPLFNFIFLTVIFLIATFVSIWFGIIYLKKAKLYRFQKKQSEESDLLDNTEGRNQIMQRVCPECGKEHDIDYPKCPYCKHSYTAR